MAVKVSSRDKQLLMILPAIVVVIAYFWIFTKAPNQQLKDLIRRINTAQSKLPSAGDVASQEARATQLRRDVYAARTEIEPLRKEVEKLVAPWMNPIRRATASELLTALWGQHDLILESQAAVSDADSRLNPILSRLVSQAREAIGGPGPNLWELRLVGSYPNMEAALIEVSQIEQPVVPVSIEMVNSEQPHAKIWRVWLWQ